MRINTLQQDHLSLEHSTAQLLHSLRSLWATLLTLHLLILCSLKNRQSWHLPFTLKCPYLGKYNEEQRMSKTRRSEEPVYEPSVDTSTETMGRHSSNVVQESEVHQIVHTLCIHECTTVCMMSTSVFCHVTCCVFICLEGYHSTEPRLPKENPTHL